MNIFLSVIILFISYFAFLIFPFVQHIVQIGGAFTSKTICTGIFLSNRSTNSMLDNELAGLSATLFVPVVDYENQVVVSTLLGLGLWSNYFGLPAPEAKYLGPKFGCQLQTLPHNSEIKQRLDIRVISDITKSFESVMSDPFYSQLSSTDETLNTCVSGVLQYQFNYASYKRNQTRAAIVSYKNTIISEMYQTEFLNISRDSRLLGWSMTKSVFSIIIGAAIQQDVLNLSTPVSLTYLDPVHAKELIELNNGMPLTFKELLQMSDILNLEEDYGIHKYVVEMLLGSYNAVKFGSGITAAGTDATRKSNVFNIRGKPSKDRLHPFKSDSSFAWYYSSAVSNLLSHELRILLGDKKYWEFPHKHLFSVIGADSFVLEMDPSGTFIASSFGYATARDWTKLGQLLLNRGQWIDSSGNTIQVIPSEYVDFMQIPHPASGGHYGGHVWLNPAR